MPRSFAADLFLLAARTASGRGPVSPCVARQLVCTSYATFGLEAAATYTDIGQFVVALDHLGRRPMRWCLPCRPTPSHDELSVVMFLARMTANRTSAALAHAKWLVPTSKIDSLLAAGRRVTDRFDGAECPITYNTPERQTEAMAASQMLPSLEAADNSANLAEPIVTEKTRINNDAGHSHRWVSTD